MTISQELINELSNAPSTKLPLKWIHVRPSEMLSGEKVPAVSELSVDGKTYNGKRYLTFHNDLIDTHGHVEPALYVKFDGLTIGYKEARNGNLLVAIALKSPNDEYNKAIGRNHVKFAIETFEEKNASLQYLDTWVALDHREFAIEIPKQVFIDAWSEALSPFVVQYLGLNDVKNSALTSTIECIVGDFIIERVVFSKQDRQMINMI